MESVLQALAHDMRSRIVRELRQSPGLTHTELLAQLRLPKGKAPQLSNRIGELEAAGLVVRADGSYSVVDVEATGRLLVAAADVNLAAQRVLAARAQAAVPDAERLAEELRAESKPDGT
jgi:DNA-binding transcriptional ArsR family regulator